MGGAGVRYLRGVHAVTKPGWPEVTPSDIAEHGLKDYAVRFGFGAAIALVAGLLGMWFGPKFGGVFLGFPAILPASLTLIQKKGGKEQAAIDSEGAVLGALAFLAFAIVVTLVVVRLGVVPTLIVGVTVWTAVAVALYAVVRIVFHREPTPP